MKISIDQLLESDRIPSLPEVALRVVEIAQDPEPDFDELIRVIKADPAIASRIARTVNSALFGFRQRVSSIDAAVPLLGANLVRTLVLSFTLADRRSPGGRLRCPYQRIWRSTVTQAVAAESLALDVQGVDDSVWFLGGILQDIGRLALLSAIPEDYARLTHEIVDGTELLQAEQDALGFTHVDVSVQLGLRWRLDNFLVDAISKHHTVVRAWNQFDPQSNQTLPLLPNGLRCASLVSDYLEGLRAGKPCADDRLKEALAEAFPVPAIQLDELLQNVDDRTSEVAAMFSIDVGEYLPVDQLLDQARRTLANIAVQSQLPSNTLAHRLAVIDQELGDVQLGPPSSDSTPSTGR